MGREEWRKIEGKVYEEGELRKVDGRAGKGKLKRTLREKREGVSGGLVGPVLTGSLFRPL